MQVRKYRAPSMKEALNQVKMDLGKDALIIDTKKVRQKGLGGFFKPAQTEVTAVLERPNLQPLFMQQSTDDGTKKEIAQLRELVKTIQAETALNNVHSSTSLSPKGTLERSMASVRSGLLKTGMDDESADFILQELVIQGADFKNANTIQDSIKEIIGKQISCDCFQSAKDIKKPYLVFLVGTTGVGKTTTIAKLAAKYHLMENFKVGLITIDTYRIAAVEQLRTYAEIINIPIEVAYDKYEYYKALKRYSDMDLIFVDTAGRSQQNLTQINELRDFLAVKKPDEMHLVISASYKMKDQKSVLAAFMPLGVTHLVYSKIDESTGFGSLFGILRISNLPLSFIADGQRVPEDLIVATKDRVTELILEG